MLSRVPEDSENVKTSQAYFFEGFISFFEDFSLTNSVIVHNYIPSTFNFSVRELKTSGINVYCHSAIVWYS